MLGLPLSLLAFAGVCTGADVIVQTTNIIDSKVFIDIGPHHQCYRLLNGTHQIGCQTGPHGKRVGVIHKISDDVDLNWVLENKGDVAPYVAVMDIGDSSIYTSETRRKLRSSEHVSGLILYNNGSKPFSPDHSCPNSLFEYYKGTDFQQCKNQTWNPVGGDGLWFHDWPFPIALLQNQTQIALVNACFEKFNKPINRTIPRGYPLCSAEYDFFMTAAKDAPTCLRRNELFTRMDARYRDRNCDPLDGDNVLGFFPPTNKQQELNVDSVFVVATRTDSFSGFDSYSPGQESAMSGLVALLATMDTFFAALEKKAPDMQVSPFKHVMFVMFNGESLGYIGSSRMAYDMENDRFPAELVATTVNQSALFKVENIGQWLEFEQLGLSESVYLHLDPISTKKNASVKDVVKEMQVVLKDFKRVSSDKPLPPASVQTFLKKRAFPALVVTDHESEFTNPFYNSPSDLLRDKKDKLVEKMTTIAKPVAQLIFKFLYPDASLPEIAVREARVQQLVDCFLSNAGNCTLFQNIIRSSNDVDFQGWLTHTASHIMSSYMGPKGAAHLPSFYALGIANDLLTEQRVSMNRTDRTKCNWELFGDAIAKDDIYSYVWTIEDIWDGVPANPDQGFCVKTTARTSVAKSPAFEIEGYDFASGQYSTWVESVWDHDPKLRLFLQPSLRWEGSVFAIGLIVLITAFVVVFLCVRSSDAIFESSVYAVNAAHHGG